MSSLKPYPLPATSRVFFWAPRREPDDDDSLMIRPPSPTSSLRACFVRSRPTSLAWGSQDDFSNLNFSQFAMRPESDSSSLSSCSFYSTVSEFSSMDSQDSGANTGDEAAEPINQVDDIAKGLSEALHRLGHTRRRRYSHSDAHPTFTSASRYTLTPLKFLGRSKTQARTVVPCTPTTTGHDTEVEADIIIVDKQGNGKARTWKGLRKGVSSILTWKDSVSSKVKLDDSAHPPAAAKNGHSRPSIFTIRRRGTIGSTHAPPSTTTNTPPTTTYTPSTAINTPPTASDPPRLRRVLIKKRRLHALGLTTAAIEPPAVEPKTEAPTALLPTEITGPRAELPTQAIMPRADLRRSRCRSRSLSSFRIEPDTFFVGYSCEETDEAAEAAADIAAIMGGACVWTFEDYR
jgi:hypothetical protein